ncbi:MAG TPA: hypothetical protein VHE53_03940 [Patescibacteria group bacterium]|nr:hypothetical protein [Patescibacteria group bacterium]
MPKKKKISKLKASHKNGLILIGLIIFLTLVLVFTKSHLAIKSAQDNKPVVTTKLPTSTPIPSPIQSFPTPTTVLLSPSPTIPTYKYILYKSLDEIHVHPKSTGFAISATLRDGKSWEIITNQDGFKYTWTIDNPNLVKPGYSAGSGCTQGIQPPCPDDHFSFYATQSGQTLIRVNVTKDGETVASTTFPLIIED